MKKQTPRLQRVASMLPIALLCTVEAALACGGPESGPRPSYLQATAITVGAASVILGTPYLAFGFINMLAGDSKQGFARIATFIGSVGLCVVCALIIEHG